MGPVAPVAPDDPVAPVAPCAPVAPVAPVAPPGPAGPVAPVGPAKAEAAAGEQLPRRPEAPSKHASWPCCGEAGSAGNRTAPSDCTRRRSSAPPLLRTLKPPPGGSVMRTSAACAAATCRDAVQAINAARTWRPCRGPEEIVCMAQPVLIFLRNEFFAGCLFPNRETGRATTLGSRQRFGAVVRKTACVFRFGCMARRLQHLSSLLRNLTGESAPCQGTPHGFFLDFHGAQRHG